ncbi:MAG: peptide deformylase [Nitrospinota bacterium]|nr:peptide deformylase [Nitrospinota bacterium]MDH5755303.1 peptide deformylase [Nitrospinota bacterium]
MASLPIITYPDSRLKTPSEPVEKVDEALLAFIADLEQTMRAGPGGVGIAAPQVGRAIRVAIVDVSSRKDTPNNGRVVLINPEITKWDGFAVGREGCMSVPDYTGAVIRAEKIELQCLDELGAERTYQMEGFEARAAQHEIDHLDGLLFLDRLVSRSGDLFRRKAYKKKGE